MGKVYLTAAGVVTSGTISQLNMSDARQLCLQRRRQIAFHHLRVVDVILQPEIILADGIDNLQGLPCGRHQEARIVDTVQRLHQ